MKTFLTTTLQTLELVLQLEPRSAANEVFMRTRAVVIGDEDAARKMII